ncbi:ATPase [Streptomyces cynarae]|uniref:ATPase n=1 Tax=Streptomyces cynarae TaxID=2981134 RepID=A0ABY6DT85_9ACTN|nr:BadF/BadG/BcrA/BcrD ATPase family protein [Streptomyces cynarae]UXY17557.1 ATPase [Streptomyces cynarae]
MMARLVVAVDGGNSKTDVALVNEDGALLSWVRGPGSALGPGRTAAVVTRLATVAAYDAGLGPAQLAVAHAACCLAGADLPGQVEALHTALTAGRVWGSVEVRNDAWALLRTGATQDAPAVAVVCGAGLKCVARADDDRRFEFPGLGWQSGDLSGAGDLLAREAVRAAARAEDGRGPATALRQAICARYAVASVREIAERLVAGDLTERQLDVLVPVVLSHAHDGDPVAFTLVERLAVEVATLARTARRQFAPTSFPWSLVLGGGLFADPDGRMLAAVRAAAPGLEEEFRIGVPDAPPVAGAALLGLDQVAAVVSEKTVCRAFLDAKPRMTAAE